MTNVGRIWVSGCIAFVAAGLIVYAIMSLAIVAPIRSQKEALAKQLDDVQNGAARLLAEAKGFADNKSYDSALKTLDTLFEKQPGSSQVVEGRKLYAEIEIKAQAKEKKWNAAVPAIRVAWEKAKAAELMADVEQQKQLLETGMAETLATEWEKAKDQIKQDWEKK